MSGSPTMRRRSGVIAEKMGMPRIFADDGRHVPVTVLKLDACQVMAQRTEESHGYWALQLGAGKAKVKNVSGAMRGHASSTARARPSTITETPPSRGGRRPVAGHFE